MEKRIYQILALVIVFSIGTVQMAEPSIGFGGPRQIPKEELKRDDHVKRVNSIFAASGGDKPNNPEILSGSEQVVAGLKYVYTVSFLVNGESRVCDISVWERKWLEQVEPHNAYIYDNKCN